MRDAETFEVIGNDPDGDSEEWSDRETEVDAVDEGGVAVFATTSAKGLGDEGVEADEKTFPKEGEDNEDAGGNADGANGFSGVGQAADHHSVDDNHGHPADFGEDERESEVKGGAKFATKDGDEGHGNLRR